MVFTQFAKSHAAQTAAYTVTLLALNAREVTQFPQLILPANIYYFILTRYAGFKEYTSVY